MVKNLLFSIIILPVFAKLSFETIKSFNFFVGTSDFFIVKQSLFEIRKICFVLCFLTLNLTISNEFGCYGF